MSSNKSTNNTELDLVNYLDGHKVEKGEYHTHTSMGKPYGAYNIPNSDIEMFFNKYKDSLFSGTDLHIIEKHTDFGPLIVDIDFKFDFDTAKREYTYTHIEKLVELYIDEITRCFQIEKEDERLLAFVFEKPNPYKSNGNTKDGIHIIFPFIVSPPMPQYYIRETVLKKVPAILEDLPLKNSYADIIDRSVIFKNGWFLYGSTKPKCSCYQLTHIIDGKLNKVNKEIYDFKNEKNLAKFFSIRTKEEEDCIPVREENKEFIEKASKKKKYRKTGHDKKLKSECNIAQLTEIVNILSPERAENFEKWMEVGWALHNIDSGNLILLDLWIKFSKKSSKFTEGACDEKWDQMKDDGLGIGSIYYWAKLDDYDSFIDIKRNDIQYYIDKSMTMTNWDIARVLYEMFKFQFVCASSKSKTWFEYKNHSWNDIDDVIALRQKISTDLCEEYCTLMSKYNDYASTDDASVTVDDKEGYLKKCETLANITLKLKTTNFKDNVIRECRELFHDSKFLNKLDTNPYLIGFENGVYDLKKMEFRDGRPDDYLSLTTGIDYVEFDEEDENWPDLKNFIETVFPREDIRNYILGFLASCLQGVNAEEKFRIWTGTGSNGKSKLHELFCMSFGEYCIKLPITLLVGKRAASNACTPEIVQAKGKRFGVFEEPNEGEKINVGLMKEFTGGDKIKGRGLHKDPIEFKPQFKLALLCNELPDVPPNDQAVWRRFEVTEFKSKFCEKPKEENEFKIDKHISEKMHNWKELFMGYLIDVHYKKYKKSGIMVPGEITKYTSEYQKHCDIYVDFMKETVEELKGELDEIVNITDLHDEFKLWYADNFNNTKFPSKREFKKYLEKRYGKSRVSLKELRGFKFKQKYEKQSINNSLSLISAF